VDSAQLASSGRSSAVVCKAPLLYSTRNEATSWLHGAPSAGCMPAALSRRRRVPRKHAFLRVGRINPDNQIVILHSGQFRMQNSKPIPSGA
jgi:hypothetical protein